VTDRPTAEQLLEQPHGMLGRRHFKELGYERRAIDAIFRELDLVYLPGYSYPLVRAADYLALIERQTYGNDRVHPTSRGRRAYS
jgi:hypothetical protein